MKKYIVTATALLLSCGVVQAASTPANIVVPVYFAEVNSTNESSAEKNRVGFIKIEETAYGLLFTPDLSGLPGGIHGFHIHENPSCSAKEQDSKMVAALSAGGHFDPTNTKQHSGPYSDQGHLGDLPALYVDSNGDATYPILAPRLKSLTEITQRSLMIHAGGDNHSDSPAPLGGGGSRVACGIIK